MIGIVSHDDDVHASAVRAELRRLGADHRVLDTSRIPMRTAVALEYGADETFRARWIDVDVSVTPASDLLDLGAIWWRRPQPYQLSSDVGSMRDRLFAAGECDAAVTGLWASLDVTWVNDPDADAAANRKPHQLRLAVAEGLRIPRTCMTNDPDVARAFVTAERSRDGRVVYKPFSGTPETWRETRLLDVDDEAQLDLVRFAPVIFQEAIPGGIDIRATIVGDEIFAAEIRPSGQAAEYDFRIEPEAPIIVHLLPEAVESRLMALMRRLGLSYGAIDLRIDPEGEYVFLEVNPAGQWLFVEVATGQPITAALARLLADADRSRREAGRVARGFALA